MTFVKLGAPGTPISWGGTLGETFDQSYRGAGLVRLAQGMTELVYVTDEEKEAARLHGSHVSHAAKLEAKLECMIAMASCREICVIAGTRAAEFLDSTGGVL